MFTIRFSLILSLSMTALHWTRTKSQEACPHKYRAIPFHSICLSKSIKVNTSGLKPGEKDFILKLHNDIRGNVTPTASNMVKLVWDDEIALIAQRWADNCVYKNERSKRRKIPDRMQLGQNLAKGYPSWEKAIKSWYSEVRNFVYAGISVYLKPTNHYTQLVWASTYALGCGFADCKNVPKFYVCNYGPAGNIGNLAKPYKKGSPSSQCPAKYLKNNLCDCRRVCEGHNSLDLSTCKCKCDYDKFQLGELCKIDCTMAKIHEPTSRCNRLLKLKPKSCQMFPSVLFMCPIMCKICVVASLNIVTPFLSKRHSTQSYGVTTQTNNKPTSQVPGHAFRIINWIRGYWCIPTLTLSIMLS